MAPKMKRRDLDEADDEFFEFSLSSPATKIRRLDAEFNVAPIAEKDGEPLEIEEAMGDSSLDLPSMNEERAIVLYKPIDSHPLLGPNRSNVSLQISSDLIPGLKNGFFQRVKGGSPVDDRRTALVPWAHVCTEAAEAVEMAEEGASMEVEVEEEEGKGRGEQINTSNGGVEDQRLHPTQWQWQWQNHCMDPRSSSSSSFC
uniref:Uncharacterized protein n=1 Tax=Ananas comosus var. bracteatus TaxID=296719 RepID=A0A6V7P3K1_ANACO|nr:unnamed protein product [Ananas comosus var. bracteatus]